MSKAYSLIIEGDVTENRVFFGVGFGNYRALNEPGCGFGKLFMGVSLQKYSCKAEARLAHRSASDVGLQWRLLSISCSVVPHRSQCGRPSVFSFRLR